MFSPKLTKKKNKNTTNEVKNKPTWVSESILQEDQFISSSVKTKFERMFMNKGLGQIEISKFNPSGTTSQFLSIPVQNKTPSAPFGNMLIHLAGSDCISYIYIYNVSIPVFDNTIPAGCGHFGGLVGVPQNTDTHIIVSFEL